MRLTTTTLCLVLVLPAGLAGQVGYAPEDSPYRDLTKKLSITAIYSHIGGDGGKIGVGPHDGPTYGGRVDVVLGAPLQVGIGASWGKLQRLVVSADDSVHQRVKGPVDQDVLMIEGALQLNITGRKTWNRLAPFLGISGGWINGYSLPAGAPKDSSGYEFGSKFYYAPAAGTRLFFSRALFARLEARYVGWKLNYPNSYLREPAAEPSTDPLHPNRVLTDGKTDEWDGGFEWRVGLGFSF